MSCGASTFVTRSEYAEEAPSPECRPAEATVRTVRAHATEFDNRGYPEAQMTRTADIAFSLPGDLWSAAAGRQLLDHFTLFLCRALVRESRCTALSNSKKM